MALASSPLTIDDPSWRNRHTIRAAWSNEIGSVPNLKEARITTRLAHARDAKMLTQRRLVSTAEGKLAPVTRFSAGIELVAMVSDIG